MSLQQTITDWQAENLGRIPAELRQIMQQTTQGLVDQGIAEQALQAGDAAQDFSLPTADGHEISLAALLVQGPVVLNFYRGAWCPYCNMELKALNDITQDINKRGATLVGINPNLSQSTAEFVAENPFDFEILCDVDNIVARRYRLVFRLPDALITTYEKLGINLPAFDGNQRWELPMPATYIITEEGIIHAGFVHADYTRRMEPADILKALDELDDGVAPEVDPINWAE